MAGIFFCAWYFLALYLARAWSCRFRLSLPLRQKGEGWPGLLPVSASCVRVAASHPGHRLEMGWQGSRWWPHTPSPARAPPLAVLLDAS